jgi:hypothetical protein
MRGNNRLTMADLSTLLTKVQEKFDEEMSNRWATLLKGLCWKVLGTMLSAVLTDITHI